MMNEYYGQPYRFGGRGNRYDRKGDRAPYRRPMGRGSLPSNPCNGVGSAHNGCGCGLSQEQVHGGDVRGGCGCGGHRGQSRGVSRSCPNNAPLDQRQTRPVMEDHEQGCGCGCGEISASCQKLMEQIRAVDFALYEVILYLDVYPHSCDALETYHKLKAQREALRKEYENTCGPLTAFENQSGASWDWISSPFPWEYGAE